MDSSIGFVDLESLEERLQLIELLLQPVEQILQSGPSPLALEADAPSPSSSVESPSISLGQVSPKTAVDAPSPAISSSSSSSSSSAFVPTFPPSSVAVSSNNPFAKQSSGPSIVERLRSVKQKCSQFEPPNFETFFKKYEKVTTILESMELSSNPLPVQAKLNLLSADHSFVLDTSRKLEQVSTMERHIQFDLLDQFPALLQQLKPIEVNHLAQLQQNQEMQDRLDVLSTKYNQAIGLISSKFALAEKALMALEAKVSVIEKRQAAHS